MSFHTFTYGLFLVAVLAVVPFLGLRAANAFLLLASAVFYAAWDWRFLGLLGGSAAFNYWMGARIGAAREAGDLRAARRWLALNVFANLALLGFFKYYGFFGRTLETLLGWLGFVGAPPTLEIALPLAISFYTFHCLSYTIDIHRGHLRPARSLGDFTLYILFFPHLIAGPIVRASVLIPQIEQPRLRTREDWLAGLSLVLWGLYKKMVVADNLAPKADALFAASGATACQVVLGALAFAFQIYADFSGYTDIGRGSARLLGFRFDLNFRFPYLATDPQDFWRRWHISLSQWLRDYLYVPLGGSRQGEAKTYRNLMLTMVIGGLWHGAAWNFVLWGANHGTLLCLHRLYASRVIPSVPWLERFHAGWPGRVVSIAAMFLVTLYGWLFFRAVSLGQVVALTTALLRPNRGFEGDFAADFVRQLFYALPMFAVEGWMLRRSQAELVFRSPVANGLWYAVLVYAMIVLGAYGGEQFIYFNF